jgi:hypothetical protein
MTALSEKLKLISHVEIVAAVLHSAEASKGARLQKALGGALAVSSAKVPAMMGIVVQEVG